MADDILTEQKLFGIRLRLSTLIEHENDVKGFKRELLKAIDKGLDVNRQKYYRTGRPEDYLVFAPLLYQVITSKPAVRDGLPELLLDLGADPNAVEHGVPMLCVCADRGAPTQLLQKLIDFGADVNAQSLPAKSTPFSTACTQYIDRHQYYFGWNFEKTRQTDLANLKLLLEHGADPYLCNKWMNVRYSSKSEPEKASRQKYITQYINMFQELKETSNAPQAMYEYEL